MGVYNGAAALGKSWTVPESIKHGVPELFHLKRNENTHTQDLCANMYSSVIRNSQTVQQPRCPSAAGWVDTRRHAHMVGECMATEKKEPTVGLEH